MLSFDFWEKMIGMAFYLMLVGIGSNCAIFVYLVLVMIHCLVLSMTDKQQVQRQEHCALISIVFGSVSHCLITDIYIAIWELQ